MGKIGISNVKFQSLIKATEEPFFMYKAFHAPHFPFHAPASIRKTFLDDLAPESALPAELSLIGESRDEIERKLDTIFNLGPFMQANEHILGDAFNGHDKVMLQNLAPYLANFDHNLHHNS